MFEYIVYQCEKCGFPFVVPADGMRIAEILGRFIACPLGHMPIKEMGRYDDLRECMEAVNTYERRNGSIRQKRHKHSD